MESPIQNPETSLIFIICYYESSCRECCLDFLHSLFTLWSTQTLVVCLSLAFLFHCAWHKGTSQHTWECECLPFLYAENIKVKSQSCFTFCQTEAHCFDSWLVSQLWLWNERLQTGFWVHMNMCLCIFFLWTWTSFDFWGHPMLCV